jgi:hypothetical protein
MVLLVALHRRLVVHGEYWSPSPHPDALRLVNEILVGEETDCVAGRTWSHFELYVAAMTELGADTGAVERFLVERSLGVDPEEAARRAGAPTPALDFLDSTLRVTRGGTAAEVAACFAYGRERLIPAMFDRVLESPATGLFRAYLDRHVEVDESHGAMAEAIVADLDPDGHATTWAGAAAVAARTRLWDGIAVAIEARA